MSITVRIGKTQWVLVWNWPVWAWIPSYQCWRYTPDIDDRRSYSRTRIGPFKVQITRWS